MPFYDTINISSRHVTSYQGFNANGTTASPLYEVESLAAGSVERGFRTRAPQGTKVSLVDKRVADPYTWNQSLQAFNLSSAEKQGFDSSSLAKDKGHPWDLEKYESSPGVSFRLTAYNGGSYTNYRNANLISVAGGNAAHWANPVKGDLAGFGTLAYGKAAPTAGQFNPGRFLGELREGLPSFLPALMFDRIKGFKSIGSDYLNVQFGWLPFLNDLRELAKALVFASNGLFGPIGAQHRSYGRPPIVTQGESTGTADLSVVMGSYYAPTAFQPYLGSPSLSTTGLRSEYRFGWSEKRTVWFEGEFVYLPKAGFDPKKYEDRLATLMSTDITPSVLWQLAPWSWLTDWFVNINASLSSAETALSNRILSTYAYAMETVERKHFVELSNIRPKSYFTIYDGPGTHSRVYTTTFKRRIRANPFGFIGNPEINLSAGQQTILAALGLTKLKF